MLLPVFIFHRKNLTTCSPILLLISKKNNDARMKFYAVSSRLSTDSILCGFARGGRYNTVVRTCTSINTRAFCFNARSRNTASFHSKIAYCAAVYNPFILLPLRRSRVFRHGSRNPKTFFLSSVVVQFDGNAPSDKDWRAFRSFLWACETSSAVAI